MNRAYLILAHNDISHLTRLIDSLNYSKNVYFFIHVDMKQNLDNKFEELKKYPNVLFLKKRFSISWGGFSMVKAMVELLKSAMSSGLDFSHLVFLSGNDYPIKSHQVIESFFTENANKEIVRGFKIKDSGCQHCLDKINKKWYFDVDGNNVMINKIRVKIRNAVPQIKRNRKLIVKGKELDVVFGSQWFAITSNCADFILNFIDENPEYPAFFKNTFAPDELFFHTLIFNSPFRKNTINTGVEEYSAIWKWNNYTWSQSEKLNCTWSNDNKSTFFKSKKSKENTGTLPFLDETSYIDIKNSSLIFARKFNTTESSRLLEMIDIDRRTDD